MPQKQKSNQIVKFITLALVANFALANFALAASFTATPNSIIPGQPVTLKWDGYNSRSGVTINPGIGSKPMSGELAVNPGVTTTYTLTSEGFSEAKVTVTVSPEPSRGTVKLTPEKAKADTAQACKDFSKDVAYVTTNRAKAVWYERPASRSGLPAFKGCFIVPPDHEDKGLQSVTAVIQPEAFKNFQNQIIYGSGIDSKTVSQAQVESSNQKVAAGPVSTVIGWVLEMILSVIAVVLAQIAALAGTIFTYSVNSIINVTTMPDVVTIGWTIVRDICNMFFILALIVIAIATILRLDEYDYKKLLKDVIIMALLVNFSMVISVTIINVVNFLAAVFWNGVGISGIYAMLMKIANPLNDLGSSITGGWLGGLAAGFGKIIFMVVATVVFVALAGMFILRLVGLYVLVIFSPIAYVARILPATKKFSDDWWKHFIKYLIWAPVAMFMLRLNVIIVNTSTQFHAFGGSAEESTSFMFFILAAFMAAALLVAQQAGMVGGDVMLKAGKAVGKFTGKWAAGAAGQKWNEFMGHKYEQAEAKAKARGQQVGWGTKALFAAANPVNTVKSWMAYSEKQRHIASERAQATALEIVQEARSGVKIPHREFLAQKEEREAAKLFMNMAPGKKAQLAESLDKLNTHEGAIMRRGLWTAAIVDNHIEDMLSNPYFARDHMDAKGSISSVSAQHDFMGRFLRTDAYYNHGHVDADSQRFIGSDANEIAAKNGRWDYDGHGEIDPDGNFKDNMIVDAINPTAINKYGTTVRNFVDNGHKAYALNDMSKQGSRNRMQAQVFNYADQVFDVDVNGRLINKRWVAGIDDYKREALGLIDEGSQREAHFAPARNVMALVPGEVVHTPNPATDAHVMRFEYEDQYEGFIKSWDPTHGNPDAMRVHYAKKLGVQNPGDNGKIIKNVTIELRDRTTGAVLRTAIVGDPGAWNYDIHTKTLTP